MAGGGGAPGGRVPSAPATCRSLAFTLRWISCLRSTLAVLLLWLSWLAAAARLGFWLFSIFSAWRSGLQPTAGLLPTLESRGYRRSASASRKLAQRLSAFAPMRPNEDDCSGWWASCGRRSQRAGRQRWALSDERRAADGRKPKVLE